MQRLRDLLDAEDPAVAELARLTRAVGDLDPPRGAQDRVRDALAERSRALPRWWKPVLVMLLLAIALPTAIAGVRQLIQPQTRVPAPMPALPTPLSMPATAPAPGRHAPRPKLLLPVPPASFLPIPQEPILPSARSFATPAALLIDPPSAEPPISKPAPREPSSALDRAAPPTVTTAGSPLAALQESPHPETSGSMPASPVLAPRSEEAALVLGALRSLRRDHNALAAIRQLEAYRLRFPSGDLAEEVLALLIESFAARDDRAALSLADEYVRRFPRGRYRVEAERAKRRFQEPR